MSLSTHVLDTVRGRPAAGVAIELRRDGELLESVVTDDDGRARFGDPAPGEYELVFAVGDYFGERAVPRPRSRSASGSPTPTRTTTCRCSPPPGPTAPTAVLKGAWPLMQVASLPFRATGRRASVRGRT